MINRKLKDILLSKVDYKKAIVLLGPRQIGKTTLITEIAAKLGEYLYINGMIRRRDYYGAILHKPLLHGTLAIKR